MRDDSGTPTIGVAYLARGADVDAMSSFRRFLASYRRHGAGEKHRLYVIFKGFAEEAALRDALALFSGVEHTPVFVDDEHFDIGAYMEWAERAEERILCPVNTASEILAADWLAKLAANLAFPDVGLVGATGSYESLRELDESFPAFPNVHLRSNAFMVEREVFRNMTRGLPMKSKIDAFRFESSTESLTRKVLASGKGVRLVGRDGRGYAPDAWPSSGTFRQGRQENLLVGDNQTRNFDALPWPEKREFVLRTWGY